MTSIEGRGGKVVHGHKSRGFTSPTYKSWLNMKKRCNRPSCKDYPEYGGRGISVCERWDRSFVNFLADMGERPSLDHSPDRENVNGNYEPGNCRWATSLEQNSENRRDLCPVEIGGVAYKSIAAACRVQGVSPTTVNERVKRGMTLAEALSVKAGKLPNGRSRESYLPKSKR